MSSCEEISISWLYESQVGDSRLESTIPIVALKKVFLINNDIEVIFCNLLWATAYLSLALAWRFLVI
jgi:hypothetical protein